MTFKSFLFLLLVGNVFIVSSMNQLQVVPDDQTRFELIWSASRAFIISGASAYLSGKKDSHVISRPAGMICAVGGNFLVGNLAFKERNIPVQIVSGILGFILGSYLSGDPLI